MLRNHVRNNIIIDKLNIISIQVQKFDDIVFNTSFIEQHSCKLLFLIYYKVITINHQLIFNSMILKLIKKKTSYIDIQRTYKYIYLTNKS